MKNWQAFRKRCLWAAESFFGVWAKHGVAVLASLILFLLVFSSRVPIQGLECFSLLRSWLPLVLLLSSTKFRDYIPIARTHIPPQAGRCAGKKTLVGDRGKGDVGDAGGAGDRGGWSFFVPIGSPLFFPLLVLHGEA